MLHRKQLSMRVRMLLGSLALAAVCFVGVARLTRLMDEPWDPCFICRHPGYWRLHPGMSASTVKRILGQPTRISANKQAHKLDQATIDRVHAQLTPILNEELRLYNALFNVDPRPSGQAEMQIIQGLDRCEQQEEHLKGALSVLVREVWYYDMPGWHGEMSISIDVFGRLSGMACGYG